MSTIDAEFTETTALAPQAPQGLDITAALKNVQDFEKLKAALLDPKLHTNTISGRDRVNSAGWDRIASALSINITLLSKGSDGSPGVHRELIEDTKGKRVVAFSATLRASFGTRHKDDSGRCDSSESKHNQYEHKMASVAFTRAKNRAVCALVGGAPSDLADEAEDEVDQALRRRDNSRAGGSGLDGSAQVSVSRLVELHAAAGAPDGTLGKWLARNLDAYGLGRKLTPRQSVDAAARLTALLP